MISRKIRSLFFFFLILMGSLLVKGQSSTTLSRSFVSPPDQAKPRIYWFWLFNRVDKASIIRDLTEFKAKGISGVNLICTGGYSGAAPLFGVKYQSPQWWELFRYAVKEAKRLGVEIGFNLSAGGWTMEGPWVTPDNAMKKVVSAEIKVTGPTTVAKKLPQPKIVDGYYHDIAVQAFKVEGDGKQLAPNSTIDLTSKMKADGQLDWKAPEGQWVILRTGYTLTGDMWSKWHAYPSTPEADTFEGGDGYEIDYLNKTALDDHFNRLGKQILAETRKAGGKMAYFWADSYEAGKLTWTQDMAKQFYKFRGYDLRAYLPVLAGYTVKDTAVTTRFRNDFDRTIQDCIAENFYGHFADLCHQNGLQMGSEAAGPNNIPPEDALRNLGKTDIPAGEFWVNGNYKYPEGYNKDRMLRLNLKQTASAAHIYGKREAMAESFTQQEPNYTHWALGPGELKPYANDAFCEGINRIMLHQATSQPPSDGKPGYEFCAGQHFTPNITWWEQSPAFFSYLSRCQYMLQQGKFVGDVCFYLGERPPVLAPPKYLVEGLGAGYDLDYTNADVLLNRMSVKNKRLTLPDGMSYRLLVLQNCTSPTAEVARQVGSYQSLNVSATPSNAMSVKVIQKLRELVLNGATILGAPPENSGELKDPATDDAIVKKIAAELWGDLDGKTHTERRYGKGRVIWGKTPREVLLADGIKPDLTYPDQDTQPDKLDFIHRTTAGAELYFIINRTKQTIATDLTFRVAGKQPEIWDPVSGKMFDAKAFTQADGTITLPLKIDGFGSYFVVFRKPVTATGSGKSKMNFPELADLQNISGAWNVSFDTAWGGPANAVFPDLLSWTQRPEDGIKYYSGKATYHKTFDLVKEPNNKKQRIFLDLGDVKNVAQVRLNGKKLGILWCSPWRVELTGLLKPTGNKLEVDVINLWVNRVIGDLNLPKEKRYTKTHDVFRFDMVAKKTPPLDAGLLGPVRLLSASSL